MRTFGAYQGGTRFFACRAATIEDAIAACQVYMRKHGYQGDYQITSTQRNAPKYYNHVIPIDDDEGTEYFDPAEPAGAEVAN